MTDKFSKIIPLQEGLEWYWENFRELKIKKVPEDKSHALAYEAGMQDGLFKLRRKMLNNIKLSNMEWQDGNS